MYWESLKRVLCTVDGRKVRIQATFVNADVCLKHFLKIGKGIGGLFVYWVEHELIFTKNVDLPTIFGVSIGAIIHR